MEESWKLATAPGRYLTDGDVSNKQADWGGYKAEMEIGTSQAYCAFSGVCMHKTPEKLSLTRIQRARTYGWACPSFAGGGAVPVCAGHALS